MREFASGGPFTENLHERSRGLTISSTGDVYHTPTEQFLQSCHLWRRFILSLHE